MKLVKLSLPRTQNALARQRLFALLNEKRREHPVVWICSPPGAGKTTLATTYLAQQESPVFWYQVDQSDTDAATFFHFLAQLIDDGGPALPDFMAEHGRNTGPFARQFFREFFSRLPAHAILVFDNVQELDWQQCGEILEIAFSEIPDGMNIVALSRTAPPARLSRLILSEQLNCLTWEELKFTTEEARQFTHIDADASNEAQAWLKHCNGWAVGLLFLRNHIARHGHAGDAPPLLEERENLYRYFAGEIFDRLPQDEQQCLLKIAHLPGASADDAEQITGNVKASVLLRQLHQDRFFVERNAGSMPLYHFHPFFQDYLSAEARQRFSGAERAVLLQSAAAILEARGNIELAVHMYRDAGAFPALASLLLRCAEFMQVSGRGKTWREWLGTLPPASVDTDPWLWYWFGYSMNEIDPVGARLSLHRAEQAFQSSGNIHARLITIAALIDSYYFGLGDFTELKPCIETIQSGLEQIGIDTLDADADLRIHSSLTIALMLITPASPALPAAAQRTIQALGRSTSPAARLSAGTILLHCKEWVAIDTTRWLVAELNGLTENASISIFTRCWWCIRSALWHVYLDGALQEAEQSIARGLQLLEGRQENGMARLLFHFNYTKILLLLVANQPERALSLMNEIKPLISPSKTLKVARFLMLEANYFLLIGDFEKAIRSALESIALTNDTGLPAANSPHFDRFMAACYAEAGDFALADQCCANAMANGAGNVIESIAMRDSIRALALMRKGEQGAAIGLLQSALTVHRKCGQSAFFVRFPKLAASIAAMALDLDIEKDHVRGIIKRQRLNPPDPFSANWPWPVAVRTLGSLSLSLNGDLLAFSGKAQQRPLVLLKALLLAPDIGQTQQVIADHLWPDVADARASLNVTIHRLRKLLGNDDAIIVTGGKLSINRSLVWSDVDALTHLCDKIQTLTIDNTPSELNQAALTLLSLYRGSFSDGSDESWLLSGRNRCRNRFLDAASALGMHLESHKALTMANTLYLRALEVEPLAETMYRNLMRCAYAQNDPSAAFSAYRRCRETLSVILGKRPSAETERLAMSIGLIDSMP